MLANIRKNAVELSLCISERVSQNGVFQSPAYGGCLPSKSAHTYVRSCPRKGWGYALGLSGTPFRIFHWEFLLFPKFSFSFYFSCWATILTVVKEFLPNACTVHGLCDIFCPSLPVSHAFLLRYTMYTVPVLDALSTHFEDKVYSGGAWIVSTNIYQKRLLRARHSPKCCTYTHTRHPHPSPERKVTLLPTFYKWWDQVTYLQWQS